MVPSTHRSPGLAPLRRTILLGATRPNAVIEIITGPGVETVVSASSGQSEPAGWVRAKPPARMVRATSHT